MDCAVHFGAKLFSVQSIKHRGSRQIKLFPVVPFSNRDTFREEIGAICAKRVRILAHFVNKSAKFARNVSGFGNIWSSFVKSGAPNGAANGRDSRVSGYVYISC